MTKETADRDLGLKMNLEDTPLVQSLREELSAYEKDLEDARAEMIHTKFVLDEQVKKFENIELKSRNLKRDNKIFEKLM
jgi:hypothetical protein